MKTNWHLLTVSLALVIAGTAVAQERLPQSTTRVLPSTTGTPSAPTTLAPRQPAAQPLTNEQVDIASYAIGLQLAMGLRNDNAPVNPELILRGVRDAFTNTKTAYTDQQIQAAMAAFQREMQIRGEAKFKEIADKNKRDGAQFLAANKLQSGVKVLPTGVQYKVLKAGTLAGKTPKLTDKIKAHYHGTLLDGTTFDSSMEATGGKPLEIAVKDVIEGWADALQLMRVGDKWRLFVPAERAYGADGYATVPPNAVLIFDMELLDVVATP